MYVLSYIVTPGRARRVPISETEESELADSDSENKLNPDEYEDDTTEFEQSEVGANEASIHRYLLFSNKYVNNPSVLKHLVPFLVEHQSVKYLNSLIPVILHF